MKRYILILVLFTVSATSCLYEDKGNYEYIDIPVLKIDSINADMGPRKILVDTIKIHPVVSLGDIVDDNEFEFTWYRKIPLSKGNFKLIEISKEKNLEMILTHNGVNSFRLKILHKKTGIFAFKETSCQVYSETERGWYILKETADNNTEMDAQLRNEAGEYSPMFNIISLLTGETMSGTPVSLDYAPIRIYDQEQDSLIFIKALFPTSREDINGFDINSLNRVATIKTLFLDEIPEEGNRFFEGLSSCSTTQILVYNGGRVRTRQTERGSNFLYEFSANEVAPQFSGYAGNTNLFAYDKEKSSIVGINAGNTTFQYNPDNLVSLFKFRSANNWNSNLLLFGQSNGIIPGAMKGAGIGYALLQKKTNVDSLILLQLTFAHSSMMNNLPIVGIADTITYPEYLMPRANHLAVDQDGTKLYFSTLDNKVHIYYKGVKKERLNVLDFGNEAITWMKYVDMNIFEASKLRFKSLIIATYLNGRYKLMAFNINSNGPESAPHTMFEGEGKVRCAKYIVPSEKTDFTYVYL